VSGASVSLLLATTIRLGRFLRDIGRPVATVPPKGSRGGTFDRQPHLGAQRSRPLEERKARLGKLLSKAGDGVYLSEHLAGDGAIIFEHACRMGLEGIVSKRRDFPYRSGRFEVLDQGEEPGKPGGSKDSGWEVACRALGASNQRCVGRRSVGPWRASSLLSEHERNTNNLLPKLLPNSVARGSTRRHGTTSRLSNSLIIQYLAGRAGTGQNVLPLSSG
jgi:hypothetical protein